MCLGLTNSERLQAWDPRQRIHPKQTTTCLQNIFSEAGELNYLRHVNVLTLEILKYLSILVESLGLIILNS